MNISNGKKRKESIRKSKGKKEQGAVRVEVGTALCCG